MLRQGASVLDTTYETGLSSPSRLHDLFIAHEALSPEHREALDSSIDEAIAHYLANYAGLLEQWDSVLEEKGVQKVMIDDAVIEEFRAKAADPIREQWIADMSAQGLPAQDLYDLVQTTLTQQRGGN